MEFLFSIGRRLCRWQLVRWTPRWLPGVMVLLAVMVLVRGTRGTAETLATQAQLLLASFFGGPEAMSVVAWHTLPLALAAGVIAYGFAAGWLRFTSFGSVVLAAVIVLVGACVGGELRDGTLSTKAGEGEIHGPIAGLVGSSSLAGDSMSEDIAGTKKANDVATDEQQLRDIDWLAAPDFAKTPAKIGPIELLPKLSGAFGIVCQAGNQLLGYLVAYNPRLFLAAMLAGGYLGWAWQRRVARWTRFVPRLAPAAQASDRRRAA